MNATMTRPRWIGGSADVGGATVLLLEYVTADAPLRVDKKAGIIYGAKVLGAKSKNGRRYLPEAMKNAAGLYEGRVVNVNHPTRGNPERSAYDRFGWLSGIVIKGGELYAKQFHVLKTHPLAGPVMEAAERNPALFGLSHNADGRERRGSGGTVIESIVAVRSVDLVADPAATGGLFESVQRPLRETSRPQSSLYFRNQAEFLRFLRYGIVPG